jgi:hypothetical protein
VTTAVFAFTAVLLAPTAVDVVSAVFVAVEHPAAANPALTVNAITAKIVLFIFPVSSNIICY